LDYSYWLPTYKIEDPKIALDFYRQQLDNPDSMPIEAEEVINRINYYIPSEIIAAKPITSDKLAQPLTGYRICHPYAAARPDGEVIFETKTMKIEGDPKGRYTYEQIVSRQLETILILSLASILYKEKKAGYIKLRASFPRTFNSEKIKLYLSSLTKVMKRVENFTGIVTNQWNYIDETRAAAFSMPVKSQLSLVMDMGGGTTDIGVFERKEDKLIPIFIESLLYGGNAYLKLLSKEGDLFPKPTEKLEDRMLWLLREIRLRGFDTVVRTQYHANENSRQVALDLLLQFFSPLTYYVKLLIDALSIHRNNNKDSKQEEISVYLVGNGWSLADAINQIETGYESGYKGIMKYLLEKEGFSNLVMVNVDNNNKWPSPKAAIGFGAIEADEKYLYNSIEEASDDLNGIKSIFGFDIKLDDGSNNKFDINWHEEIPYLIQDLGYKPDLSNLKLPEDWSFIQYKKGDRVSDLETAYTKDIVGTAEKRKISRSVMTRFLELIYLDQLKRARRF